MSNEDAEYSMVMPFVTTTDNGGPHDARSYVCGFEMGNFDATLKVSASLGVLPGPIMIHAENQPQADLLAMKHRFTPVFEPVEGYEEWVVCGFGRPEVELDDEDDGDQ